MNQLFITGLCVLAGIMISFMIFRMRWNKVAADLNSKVEKLLSSGVRQLSPASATVHFSPGIKGISQKMEYLVPEIKSEPAKPVADSSASEKNQMEITPRCL